MPIKIVLMHLANQQSMSFSHLGHNPDCGLAGFEGMAWRERVGGAVPDWPCPGCPKFGNAGFDERCPWHVCV